MKSSTWKEKEKKNKNANIDKCATSYSDYCAPISNEEESISSTRKEEKPLNYSILEESIRTNYSGYDSLSNSNTEKGSITYDSGNYPSNSREVESKETHNDPNA
eukprot:8430013-Ditylum_brightwellii.AAC.1